MKAWGVEVPSQTYAGDRLLSGQGSLAPGRPRTKLLLLVRCDKRCVHSYKDAISAGLSESLFVYPGVLDITKVDGLSASPFFTTTSKGNRYTAKAHELSRPRILWEKFTEGESPVVMGAKVMGKFKTAFPGKAKEKESKKESAVVIFSDVDFISDQFAFRQTFFGPATANDNSTLFLNALESLSGNIDLMNVRSKGAFNRSFDVIRKIELEADKHTASKVSEINTSIRVFQAELNQLGRKANQGNITLLRNEGLEKKKRLAKKIATLKGELRKVKRSGREKIERIGKFFQYFNTLFMPFVMILFGIFYGRRRVRPRKKMASLS